MEKALKNRLLILFFILGVFLIFYFSGVGKYMSLSNIKQNRKLMQIFIENNYMDAVVVYISAFIVVTSLALPLAFLMAILGGFLFGIAFGCLYASIGATIGSCVSFLAMRYLIGNWVQNRFGNRMGKFNRELKKHGHSYLLSVHFVTVIPLVILNIFAALANVTFWTFVWTTFVGVLPGMFVYAFAGKQLTTINSVRDIFSWQVLLAFLALAILAVLPVLLKKKFTKGDGLDYV